MSVLQPVSDPSCLALIGDGGIAERHLAADAHPDVVRFVSVIDVSEKGISKVRSLPQACNMSLEARKEQGVIFTPLNGDDSLDMLLDGLKALSHQSGRVAMRVVSWYGLMPAGGSVA